MPFTTPDWVRDAVFYQIFPDRFAPSESVPKPPNLEPWDSDPTTYGFKGGDLIGVVEHLDYLQDLGVNAIYFNPLLTSAANHRYHTYDYYAVDPLLGGNAAYDKMIRETRKRGIRVVLDGVFNHASRGFFPFYHLLEAGPKSPYADWFRVHSWPVRAYDGAPNFDCWWGDPALPKLNTDTPAVRKFIFEVAEHWIRTGAAGWRLDVPGEINDDSFWQEFRRRVKSVNPEAYLVGEVWDDGRRWLHGDQFDAVMNYVLTQHVMSFTGAGHFDWANVHQDFRNVREIDAEEFGRRIDGLLRLYPPEVTAVQLNLLDSHDTPRFLSSVGGDTSALKLAVFFLMTYPGAPCVYYGDEIGITGGKDPYSRRSFVWDRSRWDQDLHEYYKRVIALRHAHPALRRGSFQPLIATGRVFGYARCLGPETIVAVMNAGRATERFDLPLHGALPDGAQLEDVWSGEVYPVAGDGLRDFKLAPRTGTVLRGL